MKFDKQKWDKYIQKQGAKNLAKRLVNNPLGVYYYNIIDKDILLDTIINDFKNPSFNPFVDKTFSTIFLLLGLNINNFILPKPIQTLTGVEALRALCDGKVLRNLTSNVLYKIENSIFLSRNKDITWSKAYIYIDYMLLDDYEVIDAEND